MPAPPTVTRSPLAERLQAARLRAFVGREPELAAFRAALAEPERPLTVLYLTGPGGIGKSTLLSRFAQEAEDAARTVVAIDARSAGRTAEAFLAHAGQALAAGRNVLLVDSFELYRAIEGWLREEFLPRLPLGTIVVFGSRLRPAPEWRHDAAWDDILEVLDVAGLAVRDAVALLEGRGVPEAQRGAVLDFAGGNPLVLSLAADAAVRSTWTPSHDVVGPLVARLVGDVPSPDHRLALDICAQAHRTTETLLRTVLSSMSRPDVDAAAVFAWLRERPFMESGPHGLYPQDVVRRALDADLRWRDPAGYRSIRESTRL